MDCDESDQEPECPVCLLPIESCLEGIEIVSSDVMAVKDCSIDFIKSDGNHTAEQIAQIQEVINRKIDTTVEVQPIGFLQNNYFHKQCFKQVTKEFMTELKTVSKLIQ